MSRLTPITPGELLKEEFLVPMGISQYACTADRRGHRRPHTGLHEVYRGAMKPLGNVRLPA